MSLSVERLAIPEVCIITPKRHGDHRGFFSEVWNARTFAEAGITLDFVQDNHARSAEKGTVRGLHFQTPPHAQDKLVRVVRGSILDVAVDIRTGSPTYGQHVSAVISAEKGNQILVPVGFAHGLVTLEPDTEVIYKVTDFYSPECDKGLRWNDPALGIDWGLGEEDAVLSAKDGVQPMLSELPAHFDYARGEHTGG
ncbi:MAG: dTDP-4-dehydrorhamnose 3,5-epimerase [Pseudomonadota bacterium]